MTLTEVTDESKCCCSCGNNIRTYDKVWGCVCHCDKDGHYIGYVANFQQVCEEWEEDNGLEGVSRMGRKYIIEIIGGEEGDMDFSTIEPYTEPDMEQVRKESYDKGYDDATAEIGSDEQAIAEKAYQKGLSDAWEAARKIGSNSMCSLKEMGFDFSQCVIDDYNPSWFVVKNYSALECIEKIRQYEQEKEEQIQVGDEVINQNKTAVVTEITNRYTRIMYSDGSGYALFAKGLTKTGRHFPEIAEVLQKMKES